MQSTSSRSNIAGNRDNEVGSSCIASYMNIHEKDKYVEEYNFPFCDDASKYEKVAKIGQGTFGYDYVMTSF